jgi:transposase
METSDPRKAYPSDVSDEEWAFVAPYLTLMRPDAPQRHHNVREVYNALRWIVRTGAQWRYLPHAWSRRGRPSTSRPNAGFGRACST